MEFIKKNWLYIAGAIAAVGFIYFNFFHETEKEKQLRVARAAKEEKRIQETLKADGEVSEPAG